MRRWGHRDEKATEPVNTGATTDPRVPASRACSPEHLAAPQQHTQVMYIAPVTSGTAGQTG